MMLMLMRMRILVHRRCVVKVEIRIHIGEEINTIRRWFRLVIRIDTTITLPFLIFFNVTTITSIIIIIFFVVVDDVVHDLGGSEERDDRNALVTAGEGIGRVNIGVAYGTKRGGISLAGESSRSILADVAHLHTLVTGCELVGSVDLGIAFGAQERRIWTAEQYGGRDLAVVALPSSSLPVDFLPVFRRHL